MKKPFRTSEINFDNILYSNPVIKDDKTNILLKYNVNNKKNQFLIQTPELVALSKPKLNKDVYEINVGLESKSSKKINNFLKFIENLDSKIENLGKNNSDWFGKSDNFYKKIIREDPKFPNGVLKLKVKKNNIPNFLKVTKNKQSDESLLENINEGSKIKLVVDIFGLWLRKKNNTYYYGVYLKPVLVDHREEVIENISFIEDSDSDNDNVNEILDTEFEQQYDNTETSVMNLQKLTMSNEKNNDVELEDSVINPISLTIEDLNTNNFSNKIKSLSSDNTDNSSVLDELLNNQQSDTSGEVENKFIEESDSDDNNNTMNMIANYDNNNSENSSSIDDSDNFNLTSEVINKN